jgi:hypothetical protein
VARGGARTGTPGRAYQNRTDLHQPIKAAPGGEYGNVTELKNAQRAIPLPNASATPSPPSQAPGGGSAPVVAPGDMNFDAPTERPQEPITAGLPMGPGPGPEALNLPSDAATTAAHLRTMYASIPAARNNDFLRLVELAEQQSWV